jgi:hypothetical protein
MESISEYLCMECKEAITDPICVSCFSKEISIWLSEQDYNQKTKDEFTKEIRDFEPTFISKVSCVVCTNKMGSVCNYCLTKEAFRVIKKHGVKGEADLIFNYKIHHLGFTRIGGI